MTTSISQSLWMPEGVHVSISTLHPHSIIFGGQSDQVELLVDKLREYAGIIEQRLLERKQIEEQKQV